MPCSYEFVPLERGELIASTLNDSTIHANGVYRIVHFGDSHIQADRITSAIRKELQHICGDGGSGIIFPYSLCGSYGPMGVDTKVTGNYSYITQLKNPSSEPIGLMGYNLHLQSNTNLSMTFNDDFKGKRSKTITIWIHSPQDTTHIILNGAWTLTQRKSLGLGIYSYTYETAIIPNEISFTAAINTSFWGLEFHSPDGLSYQQNGLVGAQFTHLISHADHVILQLNSIQPDLLIFSYGTNEAYTEIDTLAYLKQISKFIQRVKTSLPHTPILITNAPDTRSSGKIPPSQISVNETLRKAASECHAAYFDLNKAMGGWGSLYTWNKKGFLLKDMLHFNKEGAKVLGMLIGYAMLTSTNITDIKMLETMKSEISSTLCKAAKEEPKGEVAAPEVQKSKPSSEKKESAKSSKHNRIYVVKKGDTLSGIAKKTGTSIKHLTTKNKISVNDKLKLGQKLKY